jgi:hypothetical protein
MLGPGRYLLGVAELALLASCAWLGASRLRSRLLPRLGGAPAQLATTVIALALLLWVAQVLGSFAAFEAVPYLIGVAAVGVGVWAFGRRRGAGEMASPPHSRADSKPGFNWTTAVALVLAALALIHFAGGVRLRLSTGMTGFDSTWYHGPFAAGFFQSGDTLDLHFIAPQFLAWFYPANGEIFHAAGMLAFGRDLLSPLLNLGWFAGCLLACWCIGRPYRVAPWSLALGAVALSVPALADQAGEARNDIVGIFFLLAAVAVAVNAWAARDADEPSLPTGALVVVGLAAGLAAGTKLNFLLPAGVLILGLMMIAPRGARWQAFAASGLAALAGGGYWYLRNLVHSGNPLPWIDHLGPISLPAPEQALGGREAHNVLGYLTDAAVWSDWLLPGLHGGLWIVWPLLAAGALAGLVLCFSRGASPLLRVVGVVGLATALAWLVAPTSASGPEGMPRGFESGLRYLAPALVLGLALLPTAPSLRTRFAGGREVRLSFHPHRGRKVYRAPRQNGSPAALVLGMALAALVAVAVGYPVQRHYLDSRYSDPSFTTPGLNAAFKWSRDLTGARIATTSTRQYPLFGTDLSNHVQFVGEDQPHGGFVPLATCRAWRQALNEGDYDYVIATRDRIEPAKPPYPPQASWTEGPGAKPILKEPPTVVFQLEGKLDPGMCEKS